MDAGRFEITVDDDAPGTRLCLAGELDLARVAEFEARWRALAAEAETLEIDLRRLSFIDSSGLKALLAVHEAADAGAFSYALIEGPPAVHRTFVLTGLDRVLRFTDAD
jgi:anti-sigma B factor antagonist